MLQRRAIILSVLVILIATAAGACTPNVGSLGTPATPIATVTPSLGPPASDAVPPTQSPIATPTSVSTPSPIPGGSASPEPTKSDAPSPAPTATPTPALTTSPSPPATTVIRAYFQLLDPSGTGGLVPVLREVIETKAVATAAMRALLAGPNVAERAAQPPITTSVPTGTRLLDLAIRDGVATVNLSSTFETGGGSASMLGRLAQVVYTLTQFSTVDTVRFQIEGRSVTVFGGEGVLLDHPVGRADFLGQLPAVFVDRPAWGASLGNPGRVSGLANVFEATFQVQLLNANGATLAEETVMASCGTGCWGSFATRLSYHLARAQYGTLRVYDRSPRDGTPENVIEYRVWLTPSG